MGLHSQSSIEYIDEVVITTRSEELAKSCDSIISEEQVTVLEVVSPPTFKEKRFLPPASKRKDSGGSSPTALQGGGRGQEAEEGGDLISLISDMLHICKCVAK